MLLPFKVEKCGSSLKSKQSVLKKNSLLPFLIAFSVHEKSIKNPTDHVSSISSLSGQPRETVWILCHSLLLFACHPLFKTKSQVNPKNAKKEQPRLGQSFCPYHSTSAFVYH